MSVRILLAGDHFVLNRLLREALHDAVPGDLDISELTLPWPIEPFDEVGEVKEASGTENELVAALQGVEVCVTQMAPLTNHVLDQAKDLKLFGITRGGPVNANIPAASRHGVAVSYAPGRNAPATAEHTMGLILAAIRRIPQTNADLTAGTWRGDYYVYNEVGPELEGNTVGLIGFGAVGRRVSRMLNGFGADVLVFDPYVSAARLDGIAEQVELDELLARSSIVSLHARESPETDGLLDAQRIAALPAGSVVVNCARGSLVDYDALCDALDSGHLFAAALDVFPTEPIPIASRILTTPNIVMTPHLAGASKQTAARAAGIVAQDVARYVRGSPLRHCANPDTLLATHEKGASGATPDGPRS